MATSFSSLYDDFVSSQTGPGSMDLSGPIVQGGAGGMDANGRQLLSTAVPGALDPWNYTPQTPALPVGTPVSPVGGTGSLTQMPNTPLPAGMGGNNPGVDDSVRQGAWTLPGFGPMGQFGMITPPAAKLPNGTTAPAMTPNDFGYWSGENFKNVSNWANVMGPIMQMIQNSYQWGNEYNEAQRRYDAEFGRNTANDAFQQAFAGRQQAFQENEANRGQANFENQFAWQQENDKVAQDVALRQQGVNEQRFGLEQQAQNWMQQYQQQLIENERQRIEAELTAARYNAFGRGKAPVAWRGNWR